MIPKTEPVMWFNKSETERKEKTYAINWRSGRLGGIIDGVEAIKQTVYCILNTERYAYLIYSWNYGAELDEMPGKRIEYIYSELKRRITEALIQDDRIVHVDTFTFERKRGTVTVQFTVHTKNGNFGSEQVVMLNV